jgi:signal transduction histidine kinase
LCVVAGIRLRVMAGLAGWRWLRVVAWSLAGLTALVLATALVLLGLDVPVLDAGRVAVYVVSALAVAVSAGIGCLIATRLPANAIGWLLSMSGLSLAVSIFGEVYALWGLAVAAGSLPAAGLAGWLSVTAVVLTFGLLLFAVLLFPDGRLPSRRWRPVLWVLIAVLVAAVAEQLQEGTVGGATGALPAAGVADYPNPLGVLPGDGVVWLVFAVSGAIGLGAAVLVVVSVFVRRRGASAELRQQLAWLAYVAVLTIVLLGLLILTSLWGPGNELAANPFWALLWLTPVVGIPVACAVAVLKYRLYDLDIVVRKTVVAGLVAAAFTAIYAVVVAGVGAVTGHAGSSALAFAAAALAAVALQPVRARAKLLASRLVYGRRATPYEVLSHFADGIAGAFSADEVLPQMARMLTEATGAERAEVWLGSGGAERLEATWPPAAVTRDPPAGSVTGAGGRTQTFAVDHRGDRLGALRVTCSAGEPLTPAGERLVRDVAAQAGLVLRNVTLIGDLRASRQRLVAAADEARRGLERNLHDGAQQQLVALRISLGLARQAVTGSPGEAAEILAQTEQQAAEALKELRELAHGIYPPLLADLGLNAALEAQARKAAIPVIVEAPGVGRYPREIEAALYFCVLEALQNVAKYAQASAARVMLCHDGRCLAFTVEDDGKGFDRAITPAGSGLQGITDRLAALGGTIDITSTPGHGTRVTGRVPAAHDTSADGRGRGARCRDTAPGN